MAYAEDTSKGFGGSLNEHGAALAFQWRRLTRAATFVALLCSPAIFLILFMSDHMGLILSLILTVLAVVIFRGLVEVIFRKILPWVSLLGNDDLKQDDIIARRRYWYWRAKIRHTFWWAALAGILFAIHLLLPLATLLEFLPQLLVLPILIIGQFFIFFGPFLIFSARGIRSYEPGDASWGVKIDDVRGQEEAKREITRVITLWQSGEAFVKAGGKRERGLLFLGAPGTGKTMISKAIATNFNCPFVTIPGSGFAQMFLGMDAIVVQLLVHRARKLAKKWGGQCIVFIDEIDAVGMRRASLGTGHNPGPGAQGSMPTSMHDFLFFGPNGSITPTGDLVIESREWREQVFAERASTNSAARVTLMKRLSDKVDAAFPGMGGMGGMGSQALQALLVSMDGMGDPPLVKKILTNRVNTFLDAIFIVPQKIGKVQLRLARPRPRPEEIYFIGACNVPLEALDPALIRPGRMGRHIWFQTPTKEDRKDIFDLYMAKVAHEPDLDTDHRRDELARITSGYSPSMIEQACSMALTIAHSEGRPVFAWRDLVESMTTVEAGTAQNVEYVPEETRAVAIHEAGHAVCGHVYLGNELLSTRLSIRKRGGSLGHYQSMEKDERFSHFRSRLMGSLVMTVGAMAAEHVFYGENSMGVGGDLYSATALAASMVGTWGMGPEGAPLEIGPGFNPELAGSQIGKGSGPSPAWDGNGNWNWNGGSPSAGDGDTEAPGLADELVRRRLQRIGHRLMNRAGGGSAMMGDPIAAALGDPEKNRAACQLLGQAYVTAYTLVATNRDKVEHIADVLSERKELHGDEVIDLLNSVDLVKPQIDLTDESTWAKYEHVVA